MFSDPKWTIWENIIISDRCVKRFADFDVRRGSHRFRGCHRTLHHSYRGFAKLTFLWKIWYRQAIDIRGTTSGGATINLSGNVVTDTGALSITSGTGMTLATVTGQTGITLVSGDTINHRIVLNKKRVNYTLLTVDIDFDIIWSITEPRIIERGEFKISWFYG